MAIECKKNDIFLSTVLSLLQSRSGGKEINDDDGDA